MDPLHRSTGGALLAVSGLTAAATGLVGQGYAPAWAPDSRRLAFVDLQSDHAAMERLREVAENKLPLLSEAIDRAEIVRRWLEDAALCRCPTLDDCPLFEDALRLPERSFVLR